MEKIEWKEKKGRYGREQQTFAAEVEGFQVRLTWDYDEFYDFSDYGKFCEARDLSPKKFAIRNPNAWSKRDLGNGTDSWVRVDSRIFGWFQLENHPKDEVPYYVKEGMTEKEAWEKVLTRERKTVQKLADNELFAIVVTVTASRENVELGSASIGGYEVEDYVKDEDVLDAANGNGLVEEAIAEARKTLANLCTCH